MALQLEQKEDPGTRQAGYNMQCGTERTGTLFKKSTGLRRVWQKRKCTVSNGYLTISHGMRDCPPAKLNLLTCQVKPNMDDKKCFNLVSHNRTFCFQAKDEQDCVIWMSVLSHSREEVLNVAFRESQDSGGRSWEELTRAIIEEVRGMPGNRDCCDCSAPDPSWLSINLGILICSNCSRIHQEMGVHISRIQLLSLDKLATSELLLARNIGNSGFNDVMEANLHFSLKPTVHSDMAFRKKFIISKYVEKKYAKRSPAVQCSSLPGAVKDKDIFTLLQAYAENVDLSKPVLAPLQEPEETLLHLAVLLSDQTSLHIVDFLVWNSRSLVQQTVEGNTPLHYCCSHNKPECLQLLLEAKANTTISNKVGETALDVARRMRHPLCENLLLQAQSNHFNPHVHVEYERWLGQDDMFENDKDLDEKLGSDRRGSAHSQSCYHPTAAVPRPRAAEAVPQHGWLDICPSPAAYLHRLDVPQAPSHPPPLPPQQTKAGALKAMDLFCTSGFTKMEQPGPRESFQEPDPCSGCAWDVPLPWRRSLKGQMLCRVRALYDCRADWEDELTFHTGEVIVVSEKEDSNWWKGWIEGQPQRQGLFPASFVHVLSE
ncbi:arf-GAP with SH3 domain, ANK repeat and PH domain-containing protein 2-like [Pithys albifrons albifrons]|uniref:arf-GAP with SH3 domain, ANK repeat and PH domain-containing protein 2-like n=1 Tax=Pithys albifrons albifrons TaxID=3385563 RepID=UPI003A5CEC93